MPDRALTAAVALMAVLLGGAAQAQGAPLTLEPSSTTVAWGNYDAAAKPVLTVKSGDTVAIHTLLTNNPTGLERNGVPAADVEPALREVYANVPASARGP